MKKYILSLLILLIMPPAIANAQSIKGTESHIETKQSDLDLADYQIKENYEVVYDTEFLTVGKDIPAGKYRAVSEKVGYVFTLDSEQNTTNSLPVFKWSYVELADNQIIKLKDAFLTPVTDDLKPITTDAVLNGGIYLVGTDIESGTYKILSFKNESTIAIFDEFDLSSFQSTTYPSIDSADFSVEDGQLLSISNIEFSK